MQIHPASPVPIFRQIAEGIRSAVAAGVYRPGDLIPSVRVTALRLVVNPNTVQRAYEQLEREGLIFSKKGTGMVVAPQSRAAAQDGVEEGVRAGLAQAVAAARAAGLSRAAIDKLYREAWNGPASSTARGNTP
jgi:GntR family transcriptional regulator